MNAELGIDCKIEENVILGCKPSRDIDNKPPKIGNNAWIRSGSVIYTNVVIGNHLETGHNVVIREENQIGDHFKIWNNSTIEYQCQIGNDVRIHCNVLIAQYVVIEDNVFIAPGVVLTNDPHPLCAKCRGGPIIKHGVRVGANVTILPKVIIGEYALIGAGSVVTKDIPAKAIAVGNPARVVGDIANLTCSEGLVDIPYLNGKDIRSQEGRK